MSSTMYAIITYFKQIVLSFSNIEIIICIMLL